MSLNITNEEIHLIYYAETHGYSQEIIDKIIMRQYATKPVVRAIKEGMSEEEIISIMVKKTINKPKKKEWVGLRGEKYLTQSKMCEAYGTSENTYHVRIGRGWTKEQALLQISPKNWNDTYLEEYLKNVA